MKILILLFSGQIYNLCRNCKKIAFLLTFGLKQGIILSKKIKICYKGVLIMKSTGMVRPVDNLGRVVIPREIRKQFDIENGEDSFEIFVDGDKIILRKYQPSCIFCGEMDNTITYNGHVVCKTCAEKLVTLTK